MENKLTNNEEEVFNWMEDYDFDELSSSQKVLVEQTIGEDNYRLHRRITIESQYLFDEIPKPNALQLPKKRKITTIPLYQAIIAVAATILLFILIEFNANPSGAKHQISNLSKTTIIKDTLLIMDTIYLTKLVKAPVSIIHDTIEQISLISDCYSPSNRMLEATTKFNHRIISDDVLRTKGISLTEDSTSKFLTSNFKIY